jgi:hypothetical protein
VTEWRYTPGGKVKHALPDLTSRVAVCGHSVWSYPGWLGSGSQDEERTVERLPECRNCVRRGLR